MISTRRIDIGIKPDLPRGLGPRSPPLLAVETALRGRFVEVELEHVVGDGEVCRLLELLQAREPEQHLEERERGLDGAKGGPLYQRRWALGRCWWLVVVLVVICELGGCGEEGMIGGHL